jgi:type IV secretion system protein VirD4
MLDEFAQLGHLPVIEQTLALMRGYGVKLWAVLQDLAQVQQLYDQRWESFLGNAGVLQSFAPQDVVTAEYLSKRTGQTTRIASDLSIAGEHAGIHVNQIATPLMLPQDLRNMETGYSVMFTNKLKGTVRAYFPYPTKLAHMKAICELDPST